jgi:hypothetical protein
MGGAVAQFVPTYVEELLRRQQAATTGQLGVSLLLVGPELYKVDLTLLVMLGTIMKALNDKGVVLDAEWLTRLDAALDGPWPDWIVNQTNPT